MAFDWTTVDVAAMAVKEDGCWRQIRDVVAGGGCESLPQWLREQAEWGFDSLTLEADAEAWLQRMENEHLVLETSNTFDRARCGLTNEPGHKHTRYCAGPSAAERQVQRRIVAAGRR